MKKTNNSTMLILASALWLGLTNSTTHSAAARTPDDIAIDFITAIQNNDDTRIAILNKEGVDYQRVYNMTIMDENVEIVRALIDKGIDYSKTFLNAADNGDLKTVRILLDTGANVNLTDSNGITPLYMAARKGHTHVVHYLITQDNADSIRTRYQKNNPFFAAVYTIGCYFFNQGKANVNQARTSDGAIPLWTAAYNGHTEVVRYLITQGANVNQARTLDRATPLLTAASKGHLEIVRCLIALGKADVNKANKKSATPLIIAAYSGHIEVVRCLIIIGNADVNQATNNGVTPLFMAAQNGHTQVIRCLITLGADVNKARTNNGATPLFMAAQRGHIDIVSHLTQSGADIPPDTFAAVKTSNIAQTIIKGLLTRQLQATQQQMISFIKCNGTLPGCVGANCQALTQLSGDPLNRIVWYLDAQDYATLRRTGRCMAQLQADSIGRHAMLRQVASRKFLTNCAQYETNIQKGEVENLWRNLKRFLQDEDHAPLCNIEKWKAAVRRRIEELLRIKEATSSETKKDETPSTDIQISALESLINIIETYYHAARELIQAPTHSPE